MFTYADATVCAGKEVICELGCPPMGMGPGGLDL